MDGRNDISSALTPGGMNIPRPNNRAMQTIQAYNQFRQDPFTFVLQNRGINIPLEYRNNPEGAVKFLVNSGQLSQDQLNFLTTYAKNMGIRF